VIRAVVTSERLHAGIKHDLSDMVDQVPDENPLKLALREIQHLSAYATAYRYPVSSSRTKRIPGEPPEAELKAAIDATAKALDAAVKGFQVDLERPDSPAAVSGPLRT
jgi:hypothetical protein